jgi:hypothetical protein
METVQITLGGEKYPGLFALVDASDAELAMTQRWHATVTGGKMRPMMYVMGRERGTGRCLYLHRYLLGVTDRKQHVDHINHDALDNRRENLRIVTPSQNLQNKRPNLNAKSRFKGASWNGQAGKWLAQISVEGRGLYLGLFDTDVDAAIAYDAAARKHFKDYACLNFPEGVD